MTFTLPALSADTVWLTIGLLGQSMFFMRFLFQWIASEREGKSVLPTIFWYFSIAGGAVLFIYAIRQQDPVFIIGQGTGLLIYARNLYFIHRKAPHDAGQTVSSQG